MRVTVCIIFYFFSSLLLNAQNKVPDYLSLKYLIWADSVLKTMTLDEKVGQLLMPRGNYSGKPHDVATLRDWVINYKIGGIALFATHPSVQAPIVNELQTLTKVPLMIGMDFEWGLGMRLDSADRIHYNMTLGAIDGRLDVFEKMGEEIGRQCKRMGVHVNYAPVVDVNNNPNNPVINFRSFGSNKVNVADKGLAIMKGIQSQRVMCTAKHFPGHGDTDVDSHHDLPVINHDKKRLKEVELYPFQQLINNGLTGIMSAHLSIPALEPTPMMASTFSESIITKLLKEEMGFKGLVFTDAMDMQGAVKNYPNGEAMVRALLAGNDVLETFIDVPTAFNAIKNAVDKNVLSMNLLDAKVRKVLAAKAWVGLDNYAPIQLDNLVKDLNTYETDFYNRITAEESVTCLFNRKGILPIKRLDQKIAVLAIGTESAVDFYPMVRNYVDADYIRFPQNASISQTDSILNSIAMYDLVIASLHLTDIRAARNYGVTPVYEDLLKKLVNSDKVIFNLLGNVFVLNKLPELKDANTLIVGYQQNKYIEEASAQIIFGGLPSKGSLPVEIDKVFYEGLSVKVPALQRLSYGIPDQVGIDGRMLKFRIDSLVDGGLREKAYPGAVVSVAYKGKVIYQRAYGGQVYGVDSSKSTTGVALKIDDAMDNFANAPSQLNTSNTNIDRFKYTRKDDIYDLASITKIGASALAIMQLKSVGKFDENKRFKDFYPDFEGTNKSELIYKDMLTHRSGLKAWIPFWRDAIDTIAMVAAIANQESLSNQLIYDLKKVSWFKRLFGIKPKRILNIKQSFEQNLGLMENAIKVIGPKWKEFTFSNKTSTLYPFKVHDNLYIYKDMQDNLFQRIAGSPVIPNQGYVYSDLHYYTYPGMVKNITGKRFEDYLNDTYKKIGANTLTFNPLKKFDKSRIVPSEYDSLFRNVLIHGYVHDEGAAMLSGVSGHAGLFGNANDLTKLMQMYLQKGTYGGETYFSQSVIDDYTKYQFPNEKNRRAIAFDKKDFNPKIISGPTLASDASYGHSGFTGTFTWVEPQLDLVYVFLSNRVYPTRANNKISTMNIRTSLGDIIIESIKKGN